MSSPCQIMPLPRSLATTWQATIDTFPFGHSLAFDSAMSKDLISHLIRLRSVRFPRRVWLVTGGSGAGIEHFEKDPRRRRLCTFKGEAIHRGDAFALPPRKEPPDGRHSSDAMAPQCRATFRSMP